MKLESPADGFGSASARRLHSHAAARARARSLPLGWPTPRPPRPAPPRHSHNTQRNAILDLTAHLVVTSLSPVRRRASRAVRECD